MHFTKNDTVEYRKDLKGPTIFICYRVIPVIANIGDKGKRFKALISDGFPLLAGPL